MHFKTTFAIKYLIPNYNPNGEVNLVKSAQHLAVELKYIY